MKSEIQGKLQIESYLGGPERTSRDTDAGQLHLKTPGRQAFHQRQAHTATPQQMCPCSEANHSGCQLMNLLFRSRFLSFSTDTLDRVFNIFIDKKKKKKPDH